MKKYKVKINNFEFEIIQDADGKFIKPDFIKQLEQSGTALKPAVEPIILARKPLSEKNVALNVLKWGTGGLNIDETRIPIDKNDPSQRPNGSVSISEGGKNLGGRDPEINGNTLNMVKGRFPANVILDEESAKLLDKQSGISKSVGGRIGNKGSMLNMCGTNYKKGNPGYNDIGGASRFFYCAKASKSERGIGNNHPTVKPLKLMQYLVKLITPPNGIVLDPFIGSGTTAIARQKLGVRCIGIEREKEYCDIIIRRLKKV